MKVLAEDRKRYAIFFLTFLIFFIGFNYRYNFSSESKVINFCVSYPWRNLHPGKQNTLVGGLLISQQFESLVKIDNLGNIAPSIAKSWIVSDDFRKIKFHIDENKKFLNGQDVTSDDVLTSWLNSYSMSKEGPNNSLKDVLYKIEGFDKFDGIQSFSGFKIINHKEFELTFKEPFRLAIYHLRGARFAIYSQKPTEIIGSGNFSFDVETKGDQLDIFDNKGAIAFRVRLASSDEKNELINSSTCDIAYVPTGSFIKDNQISNNVGHIESEDAIHLTLTLNTKKGLFSDVKMRRAFQYLIHKEKSKAQLFLGNKSFSNVDPQIFNKLSQGRLDENEAMKIVNEGEKWLPILMSKMKSKGISFLVNNMDGLDEAFEQIQIDKFLKINLTDSSNVTKVSYNGTMNEDFSAGFISVLSFDPDGIYHALGRNGAVLNPYASNERLFQLLEDGRKITDIKKLDDHYKKVSIAFLEEVPFLHIGFSKNVLLFNKSRISVNQENFRNTLDFSDFVEK